MCVCVCVCVCVCAPVCVSEFIVLCSQSACSHAGRTRRICQGNDGELICTHLHVLYCMHVLVWLWVCMCVYVYMCVFMYV